MEQPGKQGSSVSVDSIACSFDDMYMLLYATLNYSIGRGSRGHMPPPRI
jgi:hypothetical protein